MTADSLNALFARYRATIGTHRADDILPDLIAQATYHVRPIRRTFPGPDRINGELFDDAVQDTILRLIGSEGIRPDSFAALLRESVRHALIDQTRRLKRRKDSVTLSALAEEEIFGREEPIAGDVEALKEKIAAAVSRCAPEAVAAWKDHADGMKLHEIADRDGIPLNTVKTRVKAVYQALRNHPKLERELAEYGPGELVGLEVTGGVGR